MNSFRFAVPLVLVLVACGEARNDHPSAITEPAAGLHQARVFDYDFTQGDHGFTTGFADYPVGAETFYELKAGLCSLPGLLAASGQGFMLSGNNHSDDLLMFVQGPIEGLAEGGTYHASMCVEFASDRPAGYFGPGGAPAESVAVKLGFTGAPMGVRVNDEGYHRIDADIGNQFRGGEHADVVGDIAVDDIANGAPGYWQIKRLCTADARMQATSADGRASAFVGFDSGYEWTTTVYVTRLTVTLQ